MDQNHKIVVYFAHLEYERSMINRSLCDAIRAIPQVNFRDLHELYPDFFINVALEQEILRDADLIVFQHPIYWYSLPAIMKHFIDNVFVHGFAYGNKGDALMHKDFLHVASTGASAKEYSANGIHYYPFEELVRHIEQTVRFCGMNYLPPLILHGGHSLPIMKINQHSETYRQFLTSYKPTTRN